MPYFSEEYGNPSSIYSFAGKSKKAVEDARQTVADFLGANANEFILQVAEVSLITGH